MRLDTLRRRLTALAVLLPALLPLSACGSDTPSAEAAAQEFLATFAAGDTGTASGQTDAPDSARKLMDQVRAGLKPAAVSTELTKVAEAEDGNTADAEYTLTWDLGVNRKWSYASALQLRLIDETWRVHWAPTVLHPKLAEQQSIDLQVQAPSLAPVLDRDAELLLEPDLVISVLFEPSKAGDAAGVAGKLATALSGFDPTITQQSIQDGAAKTPQGQPYQVVALRDADYAAVKPQIYELPGVRFTSGPRLLAVDRKLAPQLLPGIRKYVEGQVAGTSGWRVVTADVSGNEVQELYAKAATPAKAVSVTLSRKAQNAAQAALDGVPTAAMIVAIQPSTGELLAVAQNPIADESGALALTGRYPPGSTFKMATAVAALESGKVTADTPVGCPATVTIDGRVIPNSGKFDKGTIPMHSAFAFSCNTTFASLAVDMPQDALTNAARKLGIGVDFVVPGITTVTGSVPPATGKTERAEDGFGQGKVVASPFGLALAAATVASGTMPKPSLVRGVETKADGAPEPIAAPTLEALRGMMREVVTGGTAGALAGLPDVRGKTGTAQFGDGTHAHGWFAGYQGDLAFSVLITDAGESGKAVQAALRFLTALR
ncbi:MAG TPA: penicillin-binding transpeptidase domain-containing protein [Actinophytocola sp.]|uniref:penicillin-binding transpeptidase domain-containing protein n=1 Tax=Actinophytocola sp. TaxID=1872138 RepID=UPI002DB7342A|nr:penicillin-binding transpeptidase domain-containing protein [Actinophytocola sp.]HEU5470485.1 penicillin-binding transpeptidase domain-containing protein [Actinophytocola sp.]